MAEPEVRQPQEGQPAPGAQNRTFVSAPNQSDLRPSDMESHMAQEILDWQARSPKPLRVLGEPIASLKRRSVSGRATNSVLHLTCEIAIGKT